MPPPEKPIVSVALVGGVDTKSDATHVSSTKLTLLQNGHFTSPGAIGKRPGFAALALNVQNGVLRGGTTPTTVASARCIFGLNDASLSICDDTALYTWSSANSRWFTDPIACAVTSIVPAYTATPFVQADIVSCDRATASGYVLEAYEVALGAAAVVGAWYNILDTTSGALVAACSAGGGTSPVTTVFRLRALAYSGYFWVFYGDAAGSIFVDRITISTLAAGAPTVTTYTVASDAKTTAAGACYDVEVGHAQLVIAYQAATAGRVSVRLISSAGAVSATTHDWATGDTVVAVGITMEPVAFSFGVIAAGSAGSGTIYTRLLTTGLVTTTSQTIDSSFKATHVTGAFESAAVSAGVYRLAVFYSDSTTPYTKCGSVTTAGTVVAGLVYIASVALATRAFRDSTEIYVGVAHGSTLQSTFFMTHRVLWPATAYTARTVGRFFGGEAGCGTVGQTYYASYLSQVELLTGRAYGLAWLRKLRVAVTASVPVFTERQVTLISLDFNHAQSHVAARAGNSMYISGAQLWEFDGQACYEAGFHLYPETPVPTWGINGGGAALPGGPTYVYRFYYEAVNSQGERELSTDYAEVSTADGSGDGDSCSWSIEYLQVTNKPSLGIAVFRSTKNPPSPIQFYRVSSVDPGTAGATLNGFIPNVVGGSLKVTWLDGMSDATILSKEPDYQNSTEIDNIISPGGSVLAAGQDRMYMAGFQDPNKIWTSKQRISGRALEWNDALTIAMPVSGGAVTGIATMNGALAVFKATQIYRITGSGPNNTLSSGQFDTPVLVPSDVGCSNQKSIVVTPRGIMFQTPKGIYQLNDSWQVTYIGAPVEAYNAQAITAATMHPTLTQVRFLCSSGVTLVYDYAMEQWSTVTYTGLGACVLNGVYYYINNTSATFAIGQETPAAWADVFGSGKIQLIMETAWIKLSDCTQGYQRLRRVGVIGTYKSAHTQTIKIAFDDSGSFTDTHTLAFAAGPLQFYTKPSVQTCELVKVHVEDLPTSTTEGCAFSEIAFELAAKRGMFKKLGTSSGAV